MKKNKKSLLKKRAALVNKINHHVDFIRGSVTRISRKGKVTNGYHLTCKDENQKTITKYISKKQLSQAQRGITNMKKVQKLIAEISRLNLELLKQG